MLDKNAENLLSGIIKEAPDGYKVFTVCDFENCEVESGIKRLTEKGYIALKYSSNGDFLLSVTPTGREYFAKKQEKTLLNLAILKKVALFSFLGAFAGSFLFQLILTILKVSYA